MQKQYGAIPFVRDEGKIKVVLITSAAGYWIFPKGRYEEDLGKLGTAELEAIEEAGVEGQLYKKHSYRADVYVKSGERVDLTLYALEVSTVYKVWQESDRRKRKILPVREARKLMTSTELIKCLKKFEKEFG